MILEWIRFAVSAALLLTGLVFMILAVFGVNRFNRALNRMHAAAMGDTLGIGCCMLGLMVICGWNFTSLKLFLVILFLWLSSPTSSHLIARLEVTTGEEPEKHYRLLEKSLTPEEEDQSSQGKSHAMQAFPDEKERTDLI